MSEPDPDVTITEAGDADIDAIAAFFWEAWRSTGPAARGWAGASDEVMQELTDPELIRARIGGPERRMHLAWIAERVVGFAATRILQPTADLAGVILLEEMTGRGIGTPLVEAALQSVADAGCAEVSVRTEADNDRALTFYRQRGFEERGTDVEDVDGVTVDVIELVRAL
jgi:ribosomal protein S18 acetylase RimI-like enzyme